MKINPVTGVNLEGMTLVMKAKIFSPEYRALQFRLQLATGGFGCDPDSIGRAVFCKALCDGEEARWCRADVEGWVDPADAATFMAAQGF